MKKMNLKNVLTFALSGVLAASLLVGCGAQQSSETTQSAADNKTAGTVLLSVNPEIEVEYDDNGLILAIEGVNDDGKSIVTGFEEYKGKDCRTVVNELVKEIYEAGYFSKTVGGHTKNIVLKLEEGSAYPDDDFLEKVAEGVRETVTTCGINSSVMTVQADDLDGEGLIGQEKAKELVLAQLGLTSASFNNHEYELDDGVYEFVFSANGIEYEYEVDAHTGKILEADFDGNDDWDDLDKWDNWDDDNDDRDDDNDDRDDDNDDRDDDNDDWDDDNDDRDDNQDDDRDDDNDDWDDNQYDDRDDSQDDDNDNWDDNQYDDRDDDNDDWDDNLDDDQDDDNDDWDDNLDDDRDDDNDDWDDNNDDRDDD
ncbi:MAG: PepSY domain-containing protein [Coprococcus sp.]|nr:PepSY domain-containing protein [Coprococcus sp.]